MSSKSELFPSKWFKASDIPGTGLPVRIAKITRERIGTEQKEKPIVHFANQEKASCSTRPTSTASRQRSTRPTHRQMDRSRR